MNIENNPYKFYATVAVGTFLAIDAASDIFSRILIAEESLGLAAKEHIYYALVQPIGTAFLFLPYLCLGWICASLARVKYAKASIVMFCIGATILGLLSVLGYRESKFLMQEEYWTASIFAVAFLPFKAIPLLIALLFARFFVARRLNET